MSKKNDRFMLKINHTIAFISIIGLMLLVTACAVPHPGPICIKNQKNYGVIDGAFRSRWWNYYERGKSYLEGGCLNEAMSDFRKAIQQEHTDKRMIRTYGMHFIDYFPHRELGFAYYLQGDHDDALNEFKLSISQESSAKALYYLDQIRKKQMQNKNLKINQPSLTLIKNEITPWTRNENVTIEGTATDDQYICQILINGEFFDISGSKQNINFKKNILLPQGVHHIPVNAKNLLGGTVTKYYTIGVDYQSPIIELVSFTQLNQNTFQIEGILTDISGTKTLMIDNNEISLSGEKNQRFCIRHIVDQENQENLLLQAVDKAGNESKALINIKETIQTFEKQMLASREDSFLCAFNSKHINLTLSEWKQTNVVYTDKIYLEGYISSSSALETFMINQRHIDMNQGKFVYFSIPLKLTEEKNNIQLTIKNKNRQTLIRKLSFTRMIPEVSQLKSRLHVAMNQLKATEDAIEARDIFQHKLLNLFVQKGRFYVIPKFSNQFDPELNPIQEDDEMKVSHCTLTGNFVESVYGVEVAVRVIDNETTSVLTVKDAYSETKSNDSVTRMANSLSVRIHNEFPIMNGHIKKIENNVIQISLGKHQLKSQNRMIIFEPAKLDNEPKLLGFGRVTEKGIHSSKMIIFHTSRPVSIQDRVITQ